MPTKIEEGSRERPLGIRRWEYVAGKALKDWVTRAMKLTGKTRDEARHAILEKINEADPL